MKSNPESGSEIVTRRNPHPKDAMIPPDDEERLCVSCAGTVEYTHPCGCQYVHFEDSSTIRFCPLHEAAPELLETVRAAIDGLYLTLTASERGELRARLLATIAKIEV